MAVGRRRTLRRSGTLRASECTSDTRARSWRQYTGSGGGSGARAREASGATSRSHLTESRGLSAGISRVLSGLEAARCGPGCRDPADQLQTMTLGVDKTTRATAGKWAPFSGMGIYNSCVNDA